MAQGQERAPGPGPPAGVGERSAGRPGCMFFSQVMLNNAKNHVYLTTHRLHVVWWMLMEAPTDPHIPESTNPRSTESLNTIQYHAISVFNDYVWFPDAFPWFLRIFPIFSKILNNINNINNINNVNGQENQKTQKCLIMPRTMFI